MKYLKRHLTLVRMSALVLLMSCVSPQQGGDVSRDLGITSSDTEKLSQSKILKIIYQYNTSTFQDYTLDVADSVVMRAGLFDLGGEFLGLVPASWSVNASGFSNSDISLNAEGSTATFTPSNVGVTKISAVYAGSDPNVITTTDMTGDITVTHIQTPDAISIVAGNNQTGLVNTNLTTPLEVLVTDSFAIPIQGIEVSFSVNTGSGAIIGLSNVFTDANGRASVSVKLGTVAGGSNNIYRTTVVSDPTIFTDFNANALPGAPGMLTFTNSPASSYTNVVFSNDVLVQVRDQFSNPLDLSSGVVTLSVQSGSGNLGGTLSATFANGVAAFNDLFYDSVDTGVVIRATYAAITGDSPAFDVSATPPGACTAEIPGVFVTGQGGCHDVSSGLTWSLGTSYGMSFYDAIWDSTLAGASPPDEYDYGRTNDYNNSGCLPASYQYCDNDVSNNGPSDPPSTTSYCKDLVQGGYEDWRLPTRIELQTAIGNEGATGSAPLLNWGPGGTFISSDYFGASYYLGIAKTTGGTYNTFRSASTSRVICVRGGRTELVQLRSIAAPSELRYGKTPSTSFEVQIEQADGTRGNAENIPITVSTSSGTLSGTTTAYTDNAGIAHFDNFSLRDTTSGTVTLTFSSPGLTSATQDVDFFFEQKCTSPDGINRLDADGGCYLAATGLVWSTRTAAMIPWGNAVDASEINGFAGVTDPDPAQNYCTNMNESGYTDWRMPTYADLTALSSVGGAHLDGVTAGGIWSSTVNDATTARLMNTHAGLTYDRDTSVYSYYTICVREP